MPPNSVKIAISEILGFLGAEVVSVHGRTSLIISGVAPLGQAGQTELTFCDYEGDEAVSRISQSSAGAIICSDQLEPEVAKWAGRTLVLTKNPRFSFMSVMEKFYALPRPVGISSQAHIDASAILGERVYVGPGAYVGPDVLIGADTRVYGNVHIRGPAMVGRNCCIHPGAVIGGDGFGYWRQEDGALRWFPHVGGVVIEDDVEVGANTAIDRGTLGNTVIKRGAKIDNLVHIAHNVVIGEHCGIAASAVICGGVVIGPRTWVAPRAVVLDRITVGADVTIGLGATVIRPVKDGATVISPITRELPRN